MVAWTRVVHHSNETPPNCAMGEVWRSKAVLVVKVVNSGWCRDPGMMQTIHTIALLRYQCRQCIFPLASMWGQMLFPGITFRFSTCRSSRLMQGLHLSVKP